MDDFDIPQSKIGQSTESVIDGAIEERRNPAILANEHSFLAFAQVDSDRFAQVTRDLERNPHEILQAVEEPLNTLPTDTRRERRVTPATTVVFNLVLSHAGRQRRLPAPRKPNNKKRRAARKRVVRAHDLFGAFQSFLHDLTRARPWRNGGVRRAVMNLTISIVAAAFAGFVEEIPKLREADGPAIVRPAGAAEVSRVPLRAISVEPSPGAAPAQS